MRPVHAGDSGYAADRFSTEPPWRAVLNRTFPGIATTRTIQRDLEAGLDSRDDEAFGVATQNELPRPCRLPMSEQALGSRRIEWRTESNTAT